MNSYICRFGHSFSNEMELNSIPSNLLLMTKIPSGHHRHRPPPSPATSNSGHRHRPPTTTTTSVHHLCWPPPAAISNHHHLRPPPPATTTFSHRHQQPPPPPATVTGNYHLKPPPPPATTPGRNHPWPPATTTNTDHYHHSTLLKWYFTSNFRKNIRVFWSFVIISFQFQSYILLTKQTDSNSFNRFHSISCQPNNWSNLITFHSIPSRFQFL